MTRQKNAAAADATCACGSAKSCQPGATERPRRLERPGLGGRGSVAFELYGTLVLDGRRVPRGPCWLRQSARQSRLVWKAPDGATQDRDISPAVLRQLLAEGVLQRRAA